MRVLYVINGFDPGGAEHGLLTLIENGFFGGHQLSVLGLCRGRGDLIERVQAKLGAGRVELASSRAELTLGGCVRGIVLLVRSLLAGQDVVVLSLKQANVIGRLVLAAFPGVHCISFEHISRYRSRRGQGVYERVLRALSFRVDEIWADCRETLKDTSIYFSRRARDETVVPLFCVTDLAAKSDYAVSTPLRLAAAGRLVSRKRVDLILDAMTELLRGGLPCELDVFGDGPELEALRAKAADAGLSDRVRLHGYAANWTERARQADLFVNMSETEGFCIVIAEAMSVGLPVIATNVGGVREYGVADANLVKLGGLESRELVAAITRLARDEDLRRRLGSRARRDMYADYSAEALRRTGADAFARLALRRGSTPRRA